MFHISLVKDAHYGLPTVKVGGEATYAVARSYDEATAAAKLWLVDHLWHLPAELLLPYLNLGVRSPDINACLLVALDKLREELADSVNPLLKALLNADRLDEMADSYFSTYGVASCLAWYDDEEQSFEEVFKGMSHPSEYRTTLCDLLGVEDVDQLLFYRVE